MKYLLLCMLFLPGQALAASQIMAFKITGTGVIRHVIDGDTYIIATQNLKPLKKLISYAQKPKQMKHFRGNTLKIRLANVNTPESKHRNSSKNTALGKQISAIVKKALTGHAAEYTCFNFGYYGRPICSVNVVIKGKRMDIGEWLIRSKMSPYVTKWGSHPWLDGTYRSASKK